AFLVLIAEAGLHEAAQGRVEVTVVQQVVGDLAQDVVGIEVEPDLRAVPTRLPEAGHDGRLRLAFAFGSRASSASQPPFARRGSEGGLDPIVAGVEPAVAAVPAFVARPLVQQVSPHQPALGATAGAHLPLPVAPRFAEVDE